MKLARSPLAIANLFLLIISQLIFSGTVFAETTIGHWCDRTVPNIPQYNRIMTIIVDDEDSVKLISKFNDGSTLEQTLLRINAKDYIILESDSGDRLEINQVTGNLSMLDKDGFIRSAEVLDDSALSNGCS